MNGSVDLSVQQSSNRLSEFGERIWGKLDDRPMVAGCQAHGKPQKDGPSGFLGRVRTFAPLVRGLSAR